MLRSDNRRRQIFQTVLAALVYGVFFGVFMQSYSSQGQFSWNAALIIGIPAGVVFAFVGSRGKQKFQDKLGLATSKQQRDLYRAVKAGVLPEDPTVRGALPNFLQNQQQTLERIRKFFPFIAIFIGLQPLLAIGHTDDIIQSVLLVVVLGCAYIVVKQITVTAERLVHVSKKTVDKKLETSGSSFNRLWSVARFGVILFGFAVALFAVVFSFQGKDAFLWLGLPMSVTGLLLIVPYFLLPRRWQFVYAAAVLVSIAISIFCLYLPHGPHNHAAAYLPLPEKGYPVLTYIGWAMLHSTPVLIGAGILTVVQIMFAEVKNTPVSLRRWAMGVGIAAMAAFFVLPLRFGTAQQTPAQTTTIPETPDKTSLSTVPATESSSGVQPTLQDTYSAPDYGPATDGPSDVHFDGVRPYANQDTIIVHSVPN